MLTATFHKYNLKFKIPAGTSRGILMDKETFFLIIKDGEKEGIGECALFRGLSIDDNPDYETKLNWLCQNINLNIDLLLKKLIAFPSIQFGMEQAFLSLKSKDKFELFPSEFTKGNDEININGLVWMGDKQFMQQQISDKLSSGFTTIKLKIGAIDFDTELNLLKAIRKDFSEKEIEIRVDANGAFKSTKALEQLYKLAEFNLHSIEQPIRQNQWEEMAELCEKTPIPIALDEELIGVFDLNERMKMLDVINPQFIILKPSLVGGIKSSNEWIQLVENKNIDWWITSALESNIGLNAIAQYTYTLQSKLPQGLGTGGLFTNNIKSPLQVKNGCLIYDRKSEKSNWQEINF